MHRKQVQNFQTGRNISVYRDKHGRKLRFRDTRKQKICGIAVYKVQLYIHNVLERPVLNGWKYSTVYQCFTFLLVFSCLVLTMFTTTDHGDEEMHESHIIENILVGLERVIMIQFTVEYILRLWSAGCRSRYQGLVGRLHFAKRPFCVIDLVVVIASWVLFFGEFTIERGLFAASALRAFRFLQIVRMVRVDRRGGTWKLLGSVVYAHSKELLTAMYIAFLLLIFASYIIWQVENSSEDCQIHLNVTHRNMSWDTEVHGILPDCHFKTFGDSLWWGFITLSTIGYGDKVPVTNIGKTITAFFGVLGMAFFALPAGILGTGFALKVQEQHRQKHFARRRNPAAYLIQCVWRNYAADEDSSSVATWECALNAISGSKNRAKPTAKRIYSTTDEEVRLLQTLDQKRPSFSTWTDKLAMFRSKSMNHMGDTVDIPDDEDTIEANSSNMESDSYCNQNFLELTDTNRTAIRFIRMLKFLVARRKFKEALRPYDVKDVIEQYSAGHVDMLARIKLLQSRVENILGVNGQKECVNIGGITNFVNRVSMNGRIITLEKKLHDIDHKMDILLSRMPVANNFDAAEFAGGLRPPEQCSDSGLTHRHKAAYVEKEKWSPDPRVTKEAAF